MKKWNRTTVIVAAVLALAAVPLTVDATIVQGQWIVLAMLLGVALIIGPSFLPRRFLPTAHTKMWQLLTVRFLFVGPGVGLMCFGGGLSPLVSVAIGAVAGVGWALRRGVRRSVAT